MWQRDADLDIYFLISFQRGKEPYLLAAEHDSKQSSNSETNSAATMVRHDRLNFYQHC